MKKRILSLFVLVTMLITMLPVSAFAAYPPDSSTIIGNLTTETNTGDMNMVPMNNPGTTQKLAAGFSSNMAIIDCNKDGYLDVMIGSGGEIYRGNYVFYGDENSRTNNTFSKAYKLDRLWPFYTSTSIYDENGDLDGQYLFSGGYMFTSFAGTWPGRQLSTNNITWPINYEAETISGEQGTDYDDYYLADYNGDGHLDLVRGLANWGDYGWQHKYTPDGTWGDDNQDGVIDEQDHSTSKAGVYKYDDTDLYDNDPIHGWVMVCLNDGDETKYATDGLPTSDNFYGEAFLVEAYDPANPEIKGPVHTFGAVSPQFYDWDGDGDLDLVTGSFVDQIWYYENTGTATNPEYKAGKVIVTGPKDDNGDVIPTNFYAEGSNFKLEGGADLNPDYQLERPVVFDWDDDGKMDLLYMQEDGYVSFARNTGEFYEASADEEGYGIPILEKPVYFQQESDMLKNGAFLTPFSIDWDGDGDEDLFAGDSGGYISFIKNTTIEKGGNTYDPSWEEPVRISDTDGNVIRIIAGMSGSIQGPAERGWGYTTFSMADWDGDGDIDIVSNNIWGKIFWVENLNKTGEYKLDQFSDFQPVQVNQETPDNPSWNWWTPENNQLVTQWRTNPVAMDVNGDGLCDIIMLDYEGYLSIFYRRADGKVEPASREIYNISESPLRLTSSTLGQSGRRKLCFTDWDGDGDLDLITDDYLLPTAKSVLWHENNPTDDMPFRFEAPVSLHDRDIVLHTTAPTACDWNKDGKPDLVVGAEDGHFYYLKNTYDPNVAKSCEYYVLAGATGDGSSPESPIGSVEALIPTINKELPNATDTAYVYIMQNANAETLENGAAIGSKSNFTPWFAGRTYPQEGASVSDYSHEAKIVVSSYNYETTGTKNYLIFSDYVGSMHHLRLMGPTEFKDIILLGNRVPSTIVARGYSVSFENTEFKVSNADALINKNAHSAIHNGYVAFWGTDGTEKNATDSQVITFNSEIPVINSGNPNVSIVGALQSGTFPSSIDRTVTYRFNNPSFQAQLGWGGAATNLTKGLNIVVDNATSFEVVQNANPVTITGGLQIINNRGTRFAEVPSNVTADKTWIINSEKRANAAIDVTDVAGTFKVLGDGIATATPVGGGAAVTSDDILVLEPGTYNVTYTNVPYKYYVLAGATGDGSSPESPIGSVEALITKIDADLPNATDTAYVYIMQKPGEGDLDAGKKAADKSSYTPWFAGRTGANEGNIRPTATHKAKIIVSSYNYEKTGEKTNLIFSDMIGGMHPLRLMGPTEFKDIILLGSFLAIPVVARGYSVSFDNVEFKAMNAKGFTAGNPYGGILSGYVAFSDADGTGPNPTEDQIITFNSAIPIINETAANVYIVGHNQFGTASTINRNITYRFNNPAFQASLAWGGAAATTLTKGLNIVVDKATSFETLQTHGNVNITGGLQIINNNGTKFADVPSNVTADNTWIINSEKNTYGTVDVTDTAGKFDIAVSGGKTPVAVDENGKVYTATKTGEITSSGDLDPETNYETNVYGDYIKYRRPLTNTYKKLTEDKELNVLYLGGSLTAGYGSTDKSKYSWRALTDAWLKEAFPSAKINPIDRTLGETGTLLAAYRLDDDILNLEKTPAPDLMFLEYSINDSYNGNLTAEEQPIYAGLQCETIIREVKEKYPECDIVIVYTGDINTIEAHRNGELHPTAAAHDAIAEAYNVPALLTGPMLSNILVGSNRAEWIEDFMSKYNYNRDGVHLNDAGNAEYFKLVKEYLNNALLCTEHGDEKIYTPVPAVVSDYLFDGDRTVHPITSELIDKSEALGGNGFGAKSQSVYYVYDTVAATTSNTSKFVFEFDGTALDIVTNFKNGAHVGAKFIIKLDDNVPYEVALSGGLYSSDNAPFSLFKDLEPGKHVVEITPSTFSDGVSEFEIQLFMTYDSTKHTTKGTAGHAAITNYNITLPEGKYDMYYLDNAVAGELPYIAAENTKILTGWTDGTTTLTADGTLASGKTYTAVTEDVKSYLDFEGVQIRQRTDNYAQGLRFVANKKNSIASDKFGIVLIPSKFIGDNRAYTEYSSAGRNSTTNIVGAENLFIGSTHEYNGRTYSSADVVAKKIFDYEYDSDEDGVADSMLYTAVLTSIPETDYATYYTAKAYVTYTFGDKEYVAYSEAFRSSIYEVARFALDTDESLDSATETYLQSLVDVVKG